MRIILSLYFCLFRYIKHGLADALAPSCPEKVTPGLLADFYFYPYKLGVVREPKSWFLAGVNTTEHLGTQPNVTEVSFEVDQQFDPDAIGDVYGFPVTVEHFAMVLTGFFKPAHTADYVFDLYKVDDGASMQVGSGLERGCCSEDFNAWVNSDDMVMRYWSDHGSMKKTYHMQEGLYYPIRIVYYNHQEAGNLGLTITPTDNLNSRSGINGGELLSPGGGPCQRPIPSSTLRSSSGTSSSARSSALSSILSQSSSASSSSFTTTVSTRASTFLSHSSSDTHSKTELSTVSSVSSKSHATRSTESVSSSVTLISSHGSSAPISSNQEVRSVTLSSSKVEHSTSSRDSSSASHSTSEKSTSLSFHPSSITTKNSVLGSSSSVIDSSSSIGHRSSDTNTASDSSGSRSSGFTGSSSMSSARYSTSEKTTFGSHSSPSVPTVSSVLSSSSGFRETSNSRDHRSSDYSSDNGSSGSRSSGFTGSSSMNYPTSARYSTSEKGASQSFHSPSITTKSSVPDSSSSALYSSGSTDHRSSDASSANGSLASKSSSFKESSSMSHHPSKSSTTSETKSSSGTMKSSVAYSDYSKSLPSSLTFSESEHTAKTSVFTLPQSRFSSHSLSSVIPMSSASKQPTLEYSSRPEAAASFSSAVLSSTSSSPTSFRRPKKSSATSKPMVGSISGTTDHSATYWHPTNLESSSETHSEDSSREWYSSTTLVSHSSPRYEAGGSSLSPTISYSETKEGSKKPTSTSAPSHILSVTSDTGQVNLPVTRETRPPQSSYRISDSNTAFGDTTALVSQSSFESGKQDAESQKLTSDNMESHSLLLQTSSLSASSITAQSTSAASATRVTTYTGEIWESNIGNRLSANKHISVSFVTVAFLLGLL